MAIPSTLDAAAVAAVARRHRLSLLVLHGSRVRGTAREASDWDFACAGEGTDKLALIADLGSVLESERVDVADLQAAGALLRFHVARDGELIYEAEPGAWTRFRLRAISFWCDAEPILRRAYAERLQRIGR